MFVVFWRIFIIFVDFQKYIPNVQLVELLDGFLICLSETYDVLYVSENISLHLGLSQVEMMGNPFWMYVNEQDFSIVNEVVLKNFLLSEK